MKPSKEYLDHIAKRLEAMNPNIVNGVNIIQEPYKMPSFEDQLGQTAMAYLANKKNQEHPAPDPLFPDRNSY
jgi:hypothetical protein